MNLRGVDLNLLVTLDALLAECNVTRAAERLGLSQPTASTQLAKLREIFDDPLLVPADKGRGMSPTARAIALQAPLHAVLRELDAIVTLRPDFDPKRDARDFVIAATDGATAVLGLPLVERLHCVAGPRVRMAFVTPDTATIAEQLESGAADLLIGAERALPQTARTRTLVTERFVVTQRKGHPRGTGPMTLDQYCALDHVLVSLSGGNFVGYMDELLASLGRRRRVAISVQQFLTAPAIVETTDYLCTLPSRLAARNAHRLDAFELPFESEIFSLHAAWHPRFHTDPQHRWLREQLVDAAREVAPPMGAAIGAAIGSAIGPAARGSTAASIDPAVTT
ncbi:MAG: LysR family transcriptional regulator [Burkholderiales bacterium]|jgi:DNA-binding transcriptional LysR family regulator|nr:LysR family transcriptional regulator [Burkholderiales bacterium]